jgi:hypothetical protein
MEVQPNEVSDAKLELLAGTGLAAGIDISPGKADVLIGFSSEGMAAFKRYVQSRGNTTTTQASGCSVRQCFLQLI